MSFRTSLNPFFSQLMSKNNVSVALLIIFVAMQKGKHTVQSEVVIIHTCKNSSWE